MTDPDQRLFALCEFGVRISAAGSVEDVVDSALLGIDELLGHSHSLLLVHQVETDRLVTLASRGYDSGGIGSEVCLGEGVIGMAGLRRAPMRIGNLQRMLAYARTVQRATAGETWPSGSEIRLPGLPEARSQLAAPMVARGGLVGVVTIESTVALAFDDIDEQILTVVAQLVGASLDPGRAASADDEQATGAVTDSSTRSAGGDHSLPFAGIPLAPLQLRYYVADGSIFIDDVYIIKGVAGRLLWKVAAEYVRTGRTAFTNREARLDPALELPAFRDNFESRLILLKRRLEDRGTPLRISGAGRGRFMLGVDAPIALKLVGSGLSARRELRRVDSE